ncbi:uncharacterized protein LOC131676764 [Topomyia yanbarensis]|uniref:uncharacterized protein LOC131676764 n=1 Tax=Topomyia yanbarensis TaxID=2498891 RepID=UPI00273C9F50|nr:uncharacterized protein LOC131676764 [Topomyia yanbarensis]XP_058812046.1 uncharacterized protein LOC131676764 [Topomyia yanbarensis]XP_058812047.1 uncharacterized protein LOC131676764 [Topomyia yanbarensis]XP_058812048.1 uncharacterized protein LOC131676764 [Topomyia yanbarensis]
MFELEEMSNGFHDVLLNKYNDAAPIMDLYVSDSMQDMLDIDIKSEVATVVGGVNEFSSLMNFDLPSLELDSNSNDAESGWCGGIPTKWSSTDIYADVGACVNPNSVMPVISSVQSLLKSPKQNVNLNTTVRAVNDPTLPSPKERKSHLTFSPNTIKVPVVVPEAKKTMISGLTQIHRISNVDTVKKDLSNHMAKDEGNKIVVRNHQPPSGGAIPSSGLGVGLGKGNTIKLAAGIGGLTFANGVQFKNLKNVQKISSIGMVNGLKRESSPARTINGTTTIPQGQTQLISINGTTQKIVNRSIIVPNGGKPANMMQLTNGVVPVTATTQKAKPKPPPEGAFPKPAYSYSCLIAMSLKNSRAGSLPVSEIYSFMCEHFPYFKTAPNGWKNSVRHNLSLNKCFEKIEKPVTNGGQRKGCLWAMNPAKITKMDEEVQKWSRKDPMAIRRAMVHPENLVLLERGEMKHGSTGDSDEGENDDADTEDQSDIEEEEEVEGEEEVEIDQEAEADSFIINTPESMPDPEQEEVDIDFDLEVPEFYDDINVDSKEGFTLEFVQKDLLTLEDEDESVYISAHQNNNQQRPQLSFQQLEPAAKRARLDVNYSISPASALAGTGTTHNNRTGFVSSTAATTTSTTINQIQLNGQQFQFTTSGQHFQQIHQQQHHNRRKTPLVTRIA